MKCPITVLFVALLFSCAGPAEPAPDDVGTTVDVGSMDVGERSDAVIDMAALDSAFGSTDTDDAANDLGTPGGFGMISGTCGVLDTELMAMEPSLIENAIDFGDDPYDDADLERLTAGGQEIIADGNAGGNSLLSEVFAYEVLARCEGAVLQKTETEVTYVDPMGKITDLLVEIDGTPIGVSVTRAVGFPREDPYTVEQATMLLTDKLDDIERSSANVAAEDAWAKQILHIIAFAPGHAASLRTAYDDLPTDVTDDTIVWVTVSDGMDDFLY